MSQQYKATGERLLDKLSRYAESDFYPFHMPGHKRNRKFMEKWMHVEGESQDSFLKNQLPYNLDITEIEGFDNLHDAKEILEECMERAARLFGAEQTFYLVNGSTAGNLAGIFSAAHHGDKIIMARNCHQSIYHAVQLRGVRPVYLYPDYYEGRELGIFCGIRAEQAEGLLEEHSDAVLMVLTSPTYEGFISELDAIVKMAHKKGIPVMVDEAHGAHLPFVSNLGRKVLSAIDARADIVVQSVHKTLPALTQTALLHWNSGFVELEKIQKYLSVFQSSSPSYLLMAGIDQSLTLIEQQGVFLFGKQEKRLFSFYQKAGQLKYLRLINPEKHVFDRFKLVIVAQGILFRGGSFNGEDLYQVLFEDYHLQMEMASRFYVIAMTSICDTEEGMERLLTALFEIDAQCGWDRTGQKETKWMELDSTATDRSEIYCTPFEAGEMKTSWIPFREAAGRVSARNIMVYPPGIPVLTAGEYMSVEIFKEICGCLEDGLPVKGLKTGKNGELEFESIFDTRNKL